MSEATKPRAIEITLPPPPLRKLEREQRAFFRLLPQLLQTHRGQWVAIHQETVAGCGADQLEVALRFWREVSKEEVYVGLVTEEPEPVIRSGIVRLRTAPVEGP